MGVWDTPPTEEEARGAGVWDSPPTAAEMGVGPSALESYARGAWQGGTLGFADEAQGLASALGGTLMGEPGSFGERYTSARDKAREQYRAAEEANPNLSTAGEVVGSLGTAFVPGLGPAKGLAGAVAKGAAVGATQGLGASEADLTKGEVGEAALDTGFGGLVGGAAGALGHGVSKVAGAIAQRARGGVRMAEADEALAEYGKRYAAKRSAQSSFGGEAAAAQRKIEWWREIADNARGDFNPQQVAQAKALLASPEAAEAVQRAGSNAMREGADKLVGSMKSAEQGYDVARAAMAPEAIEAGVEAGLANPVKRELLPRLATLGHRLLPIALPAAGFAAFGPEGGAVGTGAAGLMALTQGRPGIIIRNALRSPGVRRMAWQAVQSAGGALGKFGVALQRAVTTGGIELAHALHESLLDSDPEYQAQVQQLLEQPQGGQ